MHWPPEHVEPAPHACPQEPQFDASVAIATQVPLHTPKPAGHTSWHRPSTQDCPVAHGTLHAPQWCVFVLVSAHSGPDGVWHVTKAQVALHVPPLQNSPGAQACPQVPQLAGSLATLAHTPLHVASVTAQSAVHCPAWQSCPLAHARSHAPQCPAFVARSVHWAPQSVAPAPHVAAGGAEPISAAGGPSGSRISPLHATDERAANRKSAMFRTVRAVAATPSRRRSTSHASLRTRGH